MKTGLKTELAKLALYFVFSWVLSTVGVTLLVGWQWWAVTILLVIFGEIRYRQGRRE